MTKKNILYLIATISIFTGCLKKEKFVNPTVPNWKPEIGVPLVNSQLTLSDLIKEGNNGKISLSTDTNGLYLLTYTDTAFSAVAQDIVKIPDQVYAVPAFPLIGNVTFQDSLAFNGQGNLTQADLKAGNLSFDMTTTDITENFTVTLSFPTILNKVTGVPFSVSKNSAMQANFSLTGSFAGYDIHFKSNNQFDFNVSITGATLGTLSGTLNITNLQYSLLQGSFSSIPIGVMASQSDVTIFTDLFKGNIYFADPRVELDFESSFGVELTPNKQYFRTIYKNNSMDDVDGGDVEPSENKIVAPATTIGSKATTIFTVNNTNSTDGGGMVALKTALSKGPQKITYAVNPVLGNQKGFIKDDSKITIIGKLIIPFYGRISSYSLQDTFAISKIQYADSIDLLEFYIKTENRVPIEMRLQVYFVDTTNSYARIDSFFTDPLPLLKAPVVDLAGASVSPGIDEQTVSFPHARIKPLEKANRLIVKANMQTPNPGSQDVKFFKTNNLDIKISMHAKLNIALVK
jgi:hypothetical protein